MAMATAQITFASTRSVQCQLLSLSELNKFSVEGNIDISEKSVASGQLTIKTQMAGKDAQVSEPIALNLVGTSRTYPARSLGSSEVTLVRAKTESNGKVYQLTVASGLQGPQSTLIVQGIPFRAECKLN